MARVAWLFEDPSTLDTYEFAINPREASMPSIEKTFTPTPTAHGRPVLFQGRNRVQNMMLSGTLLTEDQYRTLRSWVGKSNQIKITDDLGRVYWVVLKSFTPRRVRSIEYPWRHEFTITGVVVSWNS